jgi:hypothetical protein
MIDVVALDSAVFARLATDSAGQGVRDLLPGGGAAVMMIEDMRVEGLTVRALPARPLLALRRGAMPLIGRIINRPVFTWYCYGDPSAGYAPLEALLKPMADCYASGLTVATVAIGEIEVGAGAQTRDDKLQLLLQTITVAVGAV